jgi:outer membrane protein
VKRSLLISLFVASTPAWAQPAQPEETRSNRALERPTPASVVLTFDDAIRRALARNPSVEIAAREIDRAEALLKQARAAWLPTLNANATYTRLDDDREINGRVLSFKSQLNGNLQLTVPIIAARGWASYSRAKDAVGISRSSQSDVRREIAVSTARAFLTVIAQRRVLNSVERALNTARAHEEYATTRLQGGVGNRLDAVRAAQERATAEVRVKNQLTALTRAQEGLGILVGEDGSVDTIADPVLEALPAPGTALTEATNRRSDIAAQRERVELARKTSRDSWVDYLPVLSAVAQPFVQDPPTVTLPRTGWQAQLLLTIPLFDGGTRYGLADEREASLAQARARLDGLLRQAKSEVRVAFEALRRADEGLAAAREAARLARDAVDLAEVAYRGGATTNIEVIDAVRRAQEAETAAAVAEDLARQARLDVLAACGRFP